MLLFAAAKALASFVCCTFGACMYADRFYKVLGKIVGLSCAFIFIRLKKGELPE